MVGSVGTNGNIEIGEYPGGHVDADDAAYRLLEGVQAGRPEEQPESQEDVGAD